MKIYLGADHRGYKLKEGLKKYLVDSGYDVLDCGNAVYDPQDDYPDFAKAVAGKVAVNQDNRGILICGSGAGMAIVANKVAGIRAALAVTPPHAFMLCNDENVNVLAISAELTTPDVAKNITDVFLTTSFSTEERHRRRVKKIE